MLTAFKRKRTTMSPILKKSKNIQILELYQMQYENLEEQESAWSKIRRSLYLIVSVSLLTHTISVTYSIMSFKEQSAGFISIIVGSVVCFFLSSSHLTIYGISILGVMYLTILEFYFKYSRADLYCIVAMSGFIIFPFWRMIHSLGSIFSSLPGRVHASMVFGIALIALTKFFPLCVENLKAFFSPAEQTEFMNPWNTLKTTFQTFRWLTLGITIVLLIIFFFLRDRLNRFPFIAVLVIIGMIINWSHYFKSFADLCSYGDDNKNSVDCTFYILNLKNIVQPTIQTLIAIIPASLVMTVVVIFQQFIYLEEFERRGKRFGAEGNLGNIKTQTRVLGLANIVSGCLGGLPICINLFATYESYAFNQNAGFRGTKLVGLMQIPVSYALYITQKWFYNQVPLFILFMVVATPVTYFVSNILRVHYRHVIFIVVLASLNVLTHPIIALVVAAFVSIYDISQLLKGIPAEILLENINTAEGERRSSTMAQVIEKADKVLTQFENRIIEIDDDKPSSFDDAAYVMYRFTGSISYLNYFGHVAEIKILIEKYVLPQKIPLLFSFRYSQVIDEESLQELAQFVESLRDQHIRVVFTGLHYAMIKKMEKIDYFGKMLQEDERCMYCFQM